MSSFGDIVRRAVLKQESARAGEFGGVTSDGLTPATFTPGAVEYVRLGDSVSTLHGLYRDQWAVRTCVDFLASNMAHLNLKSYERIDEAERVPVPDSPLAQLIQHPNTSFSRYDLIHGTMSDLGIYMNSYWWKLYRGNAKELWRLPPIFVQPEGGGYLGNVSRYRLETPNGPRYLDPGEVVHTRGYNPLDPRVGMPLLWSLKSMLAEEAAASRQRTHFNRNAARREGVIERPLDAPDWDDDMRKRFRQDWQNAYAGTENAGKTPILEDGMKWNPDTFSPKDSEFLASRQWGLDVVATAYHIPLAMLSRTNTTTYASAKEFHTVLYVDVLGTWSALIEGSVMRQLVPDFNNPDLYVEFNIDEKLQGDFEGTADALRNAIQVPFMSPNEGRAMRNLPRIDDEKFDVPATPSNYAYEGDQAAPAAPVQQLAPAASNGHGDIEAELEALTRTVEAHDE